MNGKNRFFISIMSTLLLEQLWSDVFASPSVSIIATKAPTDNQNNILVKASLNSQQGIKTFNDNQKDALAQSDQKDANFDEDDQHSNQPDQKQPNLKQIDYNIPNGKQDELWNQLISLGKKHENENQLEEAMNCYQTAALIHKNKTQQFITALEAKMKNSKEMSKSKEEIRYLEQGAKKGNAEDAYELGKIYFKRNEINKAINMWKLASKHKHQKAPYRLAVMFEKGEIVPLDLASAEYYYKVGAENGHPECSYIVAKLLELESHKNPRNTRQIMEQSLKLKQEAAERGHALAAAEIGYIYASKGDHIKAKRYFEKAYKNAESNSTITLNLKKLMRYHVTSEEYQISNSLKDISLIYY